MELPNREPTYFATLWQQAYGQQMAYPQLFNFPVVNFQPQQQPIFVQPFQPQFQLPPPPPFLPQVPPQFLPPAQFLPPQQFPPPPY